MVLAPAPAAAALKLVPGFDLHTAATTFGPHTVLCCAVLCCAVLCCCAPHIPQKQLNTSVVAVHDLQTLLEQTSAALVASQARLKETHASAHSSNDSHDRPAALQAEIAALKVKLLLT